MTGKQDLNDKFDNMVTFNYLTLTKIKLSTKNGCLQLLESKPFGK